MLARTGRYKSVVFYPAYSVLLADDALKPVAGANRDYTSVLKYNIELRCLCPPSNRPSWPN